MSFPPMRQIDPELVNQDGPTSVNFKPKSKDNGKLSVDYSDSLTPEVSFDRAKKNGMRTLGVMSICPKVTSQFGLRINYDPVEAPPLNIPNPDHHTFEFPESSNRIKTIAQRLKAASIWLYQPDN